MPAKWKNRRWTYDELVAELPETNLPTELWDGELIMSPSPFFLHQEIVDRFHDLLKAWVRPRQLGKTVAAPMDMVLTMHRVMCGPSECREVREVEGSRAIGERLGRSYATGCHRHGGNAARHERALLAEGEWKAEVDQLREHARPLRRLPALLGNARRGGRDEQRGGGVRRVAGQEQSRCPASGECGQIDHSVDRERQAPGEVRRAEATGSRPRRSRGRRGCGRRPGLPATPVDA